MWFSAGIKGAILAPFGWAILMYWAELMGLHISGAFYEWFGIMFGSFIGAIFYGLNVARSKEWKPPPEWDEF